ncbi:MAG: carboxypeptidase regulatory-like domain-containing protein [Aureispira sp.]|nr:carboxypeptidase regulatory-like domain-containing protein [Aureispira sp.]
MKITKILFLALMAVAIFSFTACKKDKKNEKTETTLTVKDSGGAALSGVTVEYFLSGTETTATTDASGQVVLNADENTDIIASMDGYRPNKGISNPGGTADIALATDDFNATYFGTAANSVADPQFNPNTLIPGNSSLGAVGSFPSGLTTVTYKGAVDPSSTSTSAWYAGWSAADRVIGGTSTTAAFTLAQKNRTKFTVTDTWMKAQTGTTISWNKDTVYVLDGFVYVPDAMTLDIPAGTIIQGKGTPSTGDNTSALIVQKNSKINAVGTAAEPIIFTFEGDQGATSFTENGKWGGLIILGQAGLNSTGSNSNIEGIPSTETRGAYGGSNNNDNSGTLKYVSIRHGGKEIGSDNEINGLTLGGVGSSTTIDYVEVVSNKDDGIEWFGGTVDATHLIVAACGDDGLDYDEGYRGTNQFVIVYQTAGAGDRGGEHDGGTDPEDAAPYATPKFYNVTSYGNGDERALTFRDNAGGEYHNSIFANYKKGVDIEDLIGKEEDSYKRYTESALQLKNNVFHNIGSATDGSGIFKISY